MPYQHCNCNYAQLCSHWSCLYASMLYKFQISRIIIHQISLFVHDWSKFMTWPYTSQLKLGNIWDYSLIFKTAHVAKTIWRIINTIGSIWQENMLSQIFVLGHYLFLEAHSFPASEYCSLLGTDNVQGQISQPIFMPDGGYC